MYWWDLRVLPLLVLITPGSLVDHVYTVVNSWVLWMEDAKLPRPGPIKWQIHGEEPTLSTIKEHSVYTEYRCQQNDLAYETSSIPRFILIGCKVFAQWHNVCGEIRNINYSSNLGFKKRETCQRWWILSTYLSHNCFCSCLWNWAYSGEKKKKNHGHNHTSKKNKTKLNLK